MRYDAAVIGSGPGGYVCAIRLAQLGKKVAVVEDREIGGTCLNRGCIPTKALLHAALTMKSLKSGEAIGISALGISFDFNRTKAWINDVVSKLRSGISFLFKSHKIELIRGRASFISPNRLSAGSGEIEAENVVIASGSRPSVIPSIKPDSRRIFTSDDIFNLEEFPRSLIVLGGGVIGVEMATAFSYLGSSVTLIEMMNQLLPGFPKDVVHPVESSLRKSGVSIRLNARAEGFELHDGRVKIALDDGSFVEGDCALLAVGRRPNVEGLNLDNAGVKLNERGFIKINDRMEAASGIFAIGDVIGLPFLAHKAMEEGYHVAEIIAGVRDSMPRFLVPQVVYSDPEIAVVGECEGSRSSKFPLMALGRAHTLNRAEGFVKVIYDESNRITGMQIVGHEASELISEASLALAHSMSLEDVSRAVHPHPTLSEAILEASRLGLGKCVHCKR